MAACTVAKQMALSPCRLHSYHTLQIHDLNLSFCVSHNLTWETCTILDYSDNLEDYFSMH